MNEVKHTPAKRIPCVVAQVSMSGKGVPSTWPWYAYPKGENSLTAMMNGSLVGPFANKGEADEFAANNWFELNPEVRP